MKVLGKLRVKGEFGKVIGGPRLAVEGVCGPQRQAYLSLPALFRHCWGSQWEARSWCTRGDGFQSPAARCQLRSLLLEVIGKPRCHGHCDHKQGS